MESDTSQEDNEMLDGAGCLRLAAHYGSPGETSRNVAT